MLEGSSIDERIIRTVGDLAKGKKQVLLALDSDHTYDHVLRELNLYSSFVTKGSYLVVFDTIIEDMPDGSFPDRPWGKDRLSIADYLTSFSLQPVSFIHLWTSVCSDVVIGDGA
jgi:cephalosporin hydroxylase